MASVTVDSSTKRLQLESIPLVDLRFLSQSDLNSLSLCANDAFDLRRCDDVVIPKIDRSVFNESAGSRKQTYSRLRLAPSKPEDTSIGRRRRCAGLLPVPKPPQNPVDDPERNENKRIISVLRELFARDNPITDLIPLVDDDGEPLPESLKVENGVPMQQFPVSVSEGERKRKRGRKPKHESKYKIPGDGNGMTNTIVVYDSGSNADSRSMEIVNRNGVVVDAAALAKVDDPFGLELRRRTAGLQTEAELLGFLRRLNGQWGSRRKKRKIVDASDFGDELPRGWKLLLSLKRKEGRVWLNCRRYISPNGQQFVSCKEVSSYLLSIFGPQNASELICGHSHENSHMAHKLTSGSNAGLTHKDGNTRENIISYSASSVAADDHDKQVTLLRAENLSEVQVRDLLECQKCSMTFNEKDTYLQHLLSFHQRGAKRCRPGSSIADGVIIKDGKYECQFCHKIFQERHRYNGHVGVHMRNYVRSLEASPGEITLQKSIDFPSLGAISSAVSKMGALVEIDKVSILETPTAKPNKELNVGSVHSKLGTTSILGTPAGSKLEPGISSLHDKQVVNTNSINKTLVSESCNKLDGDLRMTGYKLGMINNAGNISVELKSCLDSGTVLPTNEENDTEICGKDGFASTIVEINKPAIEKEMASGSSSCTLSANCQARRIENNSGTPLSSNGENDSLLTSCGKDGFADTAVEIKSSIEQEKCSESYLPTPCMNKQPCSLKSIMSEALISAAEEPKLDKMEKFGSNDMAGGLDAGLAGSGKVVVTVARRGTVEENAMQSGVIEHLLQLSDCFPTIAEMGNEHAGSQAGPGKEDVTEATGDAHEENAMQNGMSESSPMLKQLPNCFPTLDGMEIEHDDDKTGLSKDVTEVTRNSNEDNAMQSEMIEHSLQLSNCFPTIVEMGNGHAGSQAEPGKDVAKEATGDTREENAMQNGMMEPSLLLKQLSNCFPTLDGMEIENDGNKTVLGKDVTEATENTDEENTMQSGGTEPSLLSIRSSDCFPVIDEIGSELGGSQDGSSKYVAKETIDGIDEENSMQSRMIQPSLPLMQSSDCFPTFEGMGSELCGTRAGQDKNVVKEATVVNGKENTSQIGGLEPLLPLMQSSDNAIQSGMKKPSLPLMQSSDNAIQSGMREPSLPLMQSSDCFSTSDMISDKGRDGFCSVSQKLDNVSGFEELRFEEIEPQKFTYINEQESSSLPEESMNLTYDAEIDVPIQFEWEAVLPNVASNQLTALCVWCRLEFNHGAVTSETQSDSVGFICPTCKAKIAGQINVLDNESSVNPDRL